jgi:RNA polymerase sigma-70 factor (ECF subfamily)
MEKRLLSMSDLELLEVSYSSPKHFGELFDRYNKYFINIAKKYGLKQDEAEDVVQDTFIKMYKYGKKFLENKEESSEFKPWANTILRHNVIDSLRKKSHEVQLTDEMASVLDDGSDIKQEIESKDYLNSILDKIDKASAEILKLRFVFGKSFKEIGKILHITSGTARVRLYRAKKDFAEVDKEINTILTPYGK